MSDSINKGIENIKDTVNEVSHRTNAEGEQLKRDVAGDEMTGGEKVRSAVNQAKETVQADYDAAKRDVRNNS